jgi:microcystin-dependent protein
MSKRRTLQLSEGMTGTVIATILTAAPTGWLMFNGDTLGSATSGATRASADNQNLFLALWASLTNADAPVSGGRGATAAADWAANKTITLPDMRGRSIIGTGTGSGLSARTHGAKLGAETHQLSAGEIPAHRHFIMNTGSTSAGSPNVTAAQTLVRYNSTASNGSYDLNGTASDATIGLSSSVGSDVGHNNMQPSMALNWIVKI